MPVSDTPYLLIRGTLNRVEIRSKDPYAGGSAGRRQIDGSAGGNAAGPDESLGGSRQELQEFALRSNLHIRPI